MPGALDTAATDGTAPAPPGGRIVVYVAIVGDIEARIGVGPYRPESRLPSQIELASEYGAATMTVRAAIRVLHERGLVQAVHGKASVVLAPGDGSRSPACPASGSPLRSPPPDATRCR